MDHVQKEIINFKKKTKKKLNDFLSTCTLIKHHNKTTFMENLNPKCDENKYKNYKILKPQNENEIKNKNLSM
jgi:hypothetical protein